MDHCSSGDIGRDALADVFSRLPFESKLSIIPLVCKDWREASCDPACWRKVDMQPWFEKRAEEDLSWEFNCECVMEFLVKRIVDLSCGQLTKLRTTHCTDAAIEYIAERCPSLSVLSFPHSALVSHEAVATLAAKCPKLEQIDVGDCSNLSSESFEAIGRNCKSLVRLTRNMLHKSDQAVGGDDEVAIALSRYAPNLRHLEMQKASLTDVGVWHLARGCTQLESLDLSACIELTPEGLNDFNKFCPRLRAFIRPVVPRSHVDFKNLQNLFFSGYF